jgi:hypothetical protein
VGSFSKKQISISLASILLLTLTLLFAIYFIKNSNDNSLEKQLSQYGKSGEQIITDFDRISQITPVKADNGYQVIDDNKQGLDITFANQPKPEIKEEDKTKIDFPDSLKDPIAINLPQGKSITMIDKNNKGNATLISRNAEVQAKQIDNQTLLEKKDIPANELKNFIQYQSEDKRKSQYYAYQKDKASGESKLKNWTIYAEGSGKESEKYEFTNAKVAIDETGNAKVFFDDGKDAKNQQAIAEVDQSLVSRAQKAVMKDAGTDILAKDPNAEPDFVVPYPYYIDKDGQIIDLKWKVLDDQKTIYVDFDVKKEQYPIALDPTLAFTVPSQSNTATVITGEGAGQLGNSLVSGDFNADGKTDLAIGASAYNPGGAPNTGRIYIFYNDGSINSTASTADAIITGDSSGIYFGYSMIVGDFNTDGVIDLAVGATGFATSTGRVFIFYNHGYYVTLSSSADVIITGETTSNFLGISLSAADFNSDGKMDLAVAAYGYARGALTNAGRVYVFNNARISGSSQILLPLTALSNADVIITGLATNGYMGYALAAGDLDIDGKTDLVVGSNYVTQNIGRVHVYSGVNLTSGSQILLDAYASNVGITYIITGESNNNYFSSSIGSLVVGDFNADGKTDLAVGAYGYSTNIGRTYIFYGGSIVSGITASSANVIITGAASSFFGSSLIAGDINADGKTDLIVASKAFSTNTGRTSIFNGGSMTATMAATSANVIINGETTNNYFGNAMVVGDFNSDGKTDLTIGAYGYGTNIGRVYILYSQNGLVDLSKGITGEAAGNFSCSMVTGDFNVDGLVDLAVAARGYVANTGRAYIFYNDGSIVNTAGVADVIITGEGGLFGISMTTGDFNADGKTDLAVGAYTAASNGRTYIFNGGSMTATMTAGFANVIIESEGGLLGISMTAGDFNADGKTDLAVGAYTYGGNTGRAYIFNGGSMSSYMLSTSANVIITGEGGNFGGMMNAGDFNADGKTDLAVAANTYTSTGRAYIFNGGSMTATMAAASANIIITGETTSNFGVFITTGDFNADGKTDLVVSATTYSANAGRAYIFNGGSMTATMAAASANIIITGETTSNFGYGLASGDFNADGKTDLAVGAYGFSGNIGRAYIFSNTATMSALSNAINANVIITGNATNDYFGFSLIAWGFNNNGKTGLIIGAYGANTNFGGIYLYEIRDNYAWQLQKTKTPNRILGNMGQEVTITGERSSYFGSSFASGDFNGDGRMDLVVGAYGYPTLGYTGRIYIFYNDSVVSTRVSDADIVITGEASGIFGYALAPGDFNGDGKLDLAVGAYGYTANAGRAYVYNGGSMTATMAATSANVIINNEGSTFLGRSLSAGDFNVDGKTDLAIGASVFSSSTGRVYIFNGGSMTAIMAATSANVIITGEATSQFGNSLAVGDFNADGKTDLAVSASGYSTNTGRAYIFNGGSMTATMLATSANVIITGETTNNYFSYTFASGDFNTDGKIDLAVGTYGYTTNTGRAYIFNGGSMTATMAATSANVIITGETTNNYFGQIFTAGDFNADGKMDLAVGAFGYATSTGRVYIFNGGSMTATMAATSANVVVTGESGAASSFGKYMGVVDINNDGKVDLVVGAPAYLNSMGKIYIYTNNEKAVVGEAVANSYLGYVMTTGDFNADGKTDLAVGAYGYNANAGRVYIFYNDGAITNASATADVIISGELNGSFANSMVAGDFNADGKIDLAVGAYQFSSSIGRVYIFNGGSMAATIAATSANSIISGEAVSVFGYSLTSGDFNTDGKTDLAIGAYGYVTNTGRVYIFNGGSMTATMAATTANVVITGGFSSGFGYFLTVGDFNADGKIDLAVSASGSTGRAYIFNGGAMTATMDATTANVVIDGQSSNFGSSLVAGDFNADGKIDLAVGAYGYNANAGRVYIFNGGSMTATIAATSANNILAGENANNLFGFSLIAGDLNTDGKMDLIVGAPGFSTNAGRVYIFYNNNGLKNSLPGTTTDTSIDSPIAGANFGSSFAIGEFSGDGNNDLVVGAQAVSSNAGTFYIYPLDAGPAFDPSYRTRGNVIMKGAVKMQ